MVDIKLITIQINNCGNGMVTTITKYETDTSEQWHGQEFFRA